jgi:uncharacterized damage-inducible protein DinB
VVEPFRHSSWATLRLLEFCGGLDPSLLNAEARGTYGPINETLAHLVAAQESYLATIEGLPAPVAQPFTSLEDLQERAERVAERWERNLDPEPHPERLVERDRRMIPIGIVLVQALHHASEHRTYVCTVLGTIEIAPPPLDGWAYADRVREVRYRRGEP